jgi:tRNA wybutosine-synthesizing protein 1
LGEVSPSLIQTLKRQKYHFIGNHSAVKKCRWLHETLVHGRPCYKQKFYGIRTHQCIRMTPTLLNCTQRCLFCWRAQSGDLKLEWDEMKLPQWDSPESIINGSIKAQRQILSGFKANPKTDMKKLKEAMNPRQAAISLAGEPTLYLHLGDLIHTFHKRKFTTFLVSNGTVPSALAKLGEKPTQLYISACAPDKKTFKQVCRPHTTKAWEKLNETLSFLPSFRCPTVIRITLARDLNMKNPKGYVKLIKKANPTYVEPKAYMHVGFSRLRVSFESTPSHLEIRQFGLHIARETGYDLIGESEESRVILLSKLSKPISFEAA